MSTVQDFEDAPVGSTATAPNGNIAVKTGRRDSEWSVYDPYGWYRDNYRSAEMVDYTLNPVAPTTAQGALDLTWSLAHEVKEGQVIPEGMRYVRRYQSGDLATFISNESWTPRYMDKVRTQDPLPDPEPDWLNAPAVIAVHETHYSAPSVWVPHLYQRGDWTNAITGKTFPWQDLTDVTPLYPKEGETL